jgi:hypothetical protein
MRKPDRGPFMSHHIRRAIGVAAAATIALVPVRGVAQSTIPTQLSDSAFWKLIVDCSEPNGYFQSDNLLSNELGWQYVIPRLLQNTKPGGIYLGVGPEQNYTYIAALKPSMAIIFDIRRGNMLMHFMYKGLFEMSPTRGEYLSRLFSRPKPAGFDTVSNVNALFAGIAAVPVDSMLYHRTMDEMKASFKRHGFALSTDDWNGIEYILTAMYNSGPNIDYNYGSGARGGGSGRPNYSMLMTANDGVGVQRSYLANDANFRAIKEMHARNLIVPIVGDFAGPKAIRSVADYLRAHNATVAAIYTSNVEQYLFQQGDNWSRYYTNVALLPIDGSTTFIRSYFGGGSANGLSLLNPVSQLLAAFKAGQIYGYNDVINMSR